MGRFPEAVAHYEDALRLQPNFPEAYAGLTIVYAEMNRRADAIAAAQKALQLASAQGQSELAEQIQAWLNAHAAEPAKSINHPTDPVSPANSGH
jgi:tetratricopeptide (TPR) repeat protein